MKQPIRFLSLFFLAGFCLMSGCTKETGYLERVTYYKPIFKSKNEVRANIKSSAVRDITEAGKIFIQENYLFLVDVNRGVHVIDVTNISQPHKIAFIPIPGCGDIAVRGTFLYADCDKDLVTIDISNPAAATLKKVISNVFPEKFYYNGYYGYNADTTKVVAGWVKVDTAIVWNAKINTGTGVVNAVSFSNLSSSSSVSNGIGGSTSRFGLLNDRMYAVSYFDLKVFNTADASNPVFVSKTSLDQGSIETIFPYRNNLFIGSQSGMYIYNTTNPDQPAKLSQFTHVRSCDPVIADGNTAYVTLHGGSACGGFSNQMDVLDITSLTNPVLIKTYALTSPRGLSKDGKLLFICDGSDGLKIFNATDATKISLIKTVSNMDAQDVITYRSTAIVTATNGLYFVNYSNLANTKLTSIIPIKK